MNRFFTLTAATGLAAGLLAAAQTPPPAVVAIRAAHLFDGKSDAAVSDAVVIVDGSHIRAAGSRLAIPAGACGLVRAAFAEVTELARRLDPRVGEPPSFDADPLRASYEIAAVSPIGPLDAQRVLAAAGARRRLDLLLALLGERAQDLRARLRRED